MTLECWLGIFFAAADSVLAAKHDILGRTVGYLSYFAWIVGLLDNICGR